MNVNYFKMIKYKNVANNSSDYVVNNRMILYRNHHSDDHFYSIKCDKFYQPQEVDTKLK